MVQQSDDDSRDFQSRLSRLEALVTLALFGAFSGADDDDGYVFRGILRDLLLERDSRPLSSNGSRDRAMLRFIEEQLLDRMKLGKRRARAPGDRAMADLLTHGSQIVSLENDLKDLRSSLDSVRKKLFELSAETHGWLSIQSLGIDLNEVSVTRFLPLRVYLSEGGDKAIDQVTEAIDFLLKSFGFYVSDDFPAVSGSWFKKWIVKSKEKVSQPEVLERLNKIERAVELKGLGEPQANIDSKQAEAISRLMLALEKTPNAAIQAGSILLIKSTKKAGPIIQVRTLSPRELIYLESNQRLLKSPSSVLERLSDCMRQQA